MSLCSSLHPFLRTKKESDAGIWAVLVVVVDGRKDLSKLCVYYRKGSAAELRRRRRCERAKVFEREGRRYPHLSTATTPETCIV